MALSKSNKGALAEYRVACFLLATGGWLVFRCMTPNSAVDMILWRKNHLPKCQVKSSSGAGAATAGNPKHLRQGNNDAIGMPVYFEIGPSPIRTWGEEAINLTRVEE